MKQGSAFPYISYAVARRTRIGFSLMTHCICHERGTRFNAVPGSTPNTRLQKYLPIFSGRSPVRRRPDRMGPLVAGLIMRVSDLPQPVLPIRLMKEMVI
jgi:hypothetical protein